jgi:hypothetical protein
LKDFQRERGGKAAQHKSYLVFSDSDGTCLVIRANFEWFGGLCFGDGCHVSAGRYGMRGSENGVQLDSGGAGSDSGFIPSAAFTTS